VSGISPLWRLLPGIRRSALLAEIAGPEIERWTELFGGRSPLGGRRLYYGGICVSMSDILVKPPGVSGELS